jgi:signal transduction histidine kinase
MAAVYGIIKNHNGSIEVASHLGKGTVVRIYLPAAGGTERALETERTVR